MRGKEFIGINSPCGYGITPACAGKSARRRGSRSAAWDHPRVCGEKRIRAFISAFAPGSPPRVRGKGTQRHHIVLHKGITPACAGKSGAFYLEVKRVEDHPRVCGEKPPICRSAYPMLGSPPRVRGKDVLPEDIQDGAGITPACAGKSCPWHGRFYPARDHPRVCGEKTFH